MQRIGRPERDECSTRRTCPGSTIRPKILTTPPTGSSRQCDSLCAPVGPGAGEGIRPGSLCPEAESGPVHSDGVAEADAPKNQSSHHRHRYRSDWMSAAPMSYNTRRPNARALAARCANRGEADGAQGRLDTATRMADADFSSGGNSGETSSPHAHTPSLGPLDELNPAGSSCRNSASSRSIANCNAVLFASLRSPRPSPS